MAKPGKQEELVWDPWVRLFHWSMAATFALGYLTRQSDYNLHLAVGYALLALVLARIAWGFAGKRHARFSDFVVGPRRLADYAIGVVRGRAPRYLGHNPAGGAMVLALLATLLAVCVSGVLLDGAENRAGPAAGFRLFLYTDWIKSFHTLATYLALALVALHLAGVAHASLLHRENLVRAMLTGRKRSAQPIQKTPG